MLRKLLILAVLLGWGMPVYGANPYYARGWGGDKTQPIGHPHLVDPADPFVTAGGTTTGAACPVLVRRTNGEWCAFLLSQRNDTDSGWYSSLMVKSTDKGSTWGTPVSAYIRTDFNYDSPTPANNLFMNGVCAGEHTATGRLHIMFTKTDGDISSGGAGQGALWTSYSDDGGSTWSSPAEFTAANPSGTTYKWLIPGPNRMICIQNGTYAGYLVCTYNTKVTNADTAYVKLAYSADNGATWNVGAIADVGDTDNDWAGESALAEIGSSGTIVINSRFSSGNATLTHTRGIQIITNPTTGTFVLQTMKDTDNVTVPTLACNWSMCVDDDGTLYAIGPQNYEVRSRVGIWYSLVGDRDGGGVPTFRRGNLIDPGYSGYTGTLWDTDSQTFCCLCETTVDYAAMSNSSRQYTTPVRFNKEYAQSTAITYPTTIDLQFNEKSSGATTTTGHQGQDFGTYDTRWKGGAAVSFDSTGVTFSGTGLGITLQQAQDSGDSLGGPYSPGIEPMTYQIAVTMPVGAAAATQYLIHGGTNRHFAFNSAHNLVVTMTDGTNTPTATSTTAFNDGVEHWVALTVGTDHKLRLYVDGTLEATSSATMSSTVGMIFTNAVVLGSTAAAASPLPASFHVSRLYVTRGQALTSGFLSGTPAKQTLAQLHGYSPRVSANDPSTISGLVLRMGDMSQPGAMDGISGTDLGRQPLVKGYGRTSFRNQVSGVGDWFGYVYSSNRVGGWGVDYDTTVGWHYRASYLSKLINGRLILAHSEKSTNLNFVQNTATFSIWLPKIKFVTNPASDQWFLDMGAASTPGFTFLRKTSDRKVTIYIYDGTNRRINAATPTGSPALADDTWYSLLFVGHGDNQPVSMYVGTFAANLGGLTWSSAYDTANVGFDDGTFNSSAELSFLANNAHTLGCDAKTGGVLIWNDDIDTAGNLAKLAAYATEQPANAGGTSSNSIGIGINLQLSELKRQREEQFFYTLAP